MRLNHFSSLVPRSERLRGNDGGVGFYAQSPVFRGERLRGNDGGVGFYAQSPIFRGERLRFGCREMAFITDGESATEPQKKLLLEGLITSPNSLKAQSKERAHAFRDGTTVAMHEEDLLMDPQDGCVDGWGMAAYGKLSGKTKAAKEAENPEVIQSLKPAGMDRRFNTTARRLIRQGPRTLLAHILNKVDASRILESEADLHPFSFENWSGMFNGVISGGRSPKIFEAVNNLYCPALGARPKGTNSGERFLLYFLGKLKLQFGSLESRVLGLDKLRRAFAETLQDFIRESAPRSSKLKGGLGGIQGAIQWSPGLNYIVTDGNVLMAYRKGRKLYLNRHLRKKGGYGYFVSSEMFQPRNGKTKLRWIELPQDHMLTLAKNAEGRIEPTLLPMVKILEN